MQFYTVCLISSKLGMQVAFLSGQVMGIFLHTVGQRVYWSVTTMYITGARLPAQTEPAERYGSSEGFPWAFFTSCQLGPRRRRLVGDVASACA